MQVTASAISLNVDDVPASSAFMTRHFGFREQMAAEGFASLTRDDAAMDVIFLRRGIEVLPEGFRDQHAAGLIVALVVTGIEDEERRLRDEGVAITMALREEPWGEKLFQVTDPNGVIVQLVEWGA
ncbi:VOC family protein [Amycolatopsis sp. NPDC059657]|uniref:VOC family protein n=1 Tax=Amycolatopsis sp. NPDC059657 TaxID=3346899 RepID=UPI00366CB6C7